jgi:uncharacterized protein (TIGR02996 family)
MTIEESFLRDICENPDDDTPRLVYADWLDEHGQPERAEFIRAQVELACRVSDSPHRRRLAARAAELLARHAERWLGPLGSLLSEWRFRRGFLDRLTISARNLLEHAEALFRTAPIRRLRLTGAEGDSQFLTAFPSWVSLTSLDLIANGLPETLVSAIPATPALQGLSRLVLCFNALTDEVVAPLCKHPFYESLESLQLDGNYLTSKSRSDLEHRFGVCMPEGYEREPDHLYPFEANGWSYWLAGIGQGFTQALLVPLRRGTETFLFDFEGNLLERQETADDLEEREKQLTITPATVYVNRFTTADGEILLDYPGHCIDCFRPEEPYSEEDRQGALEFLREAWLPQGQFEFTAGNSPWINGKGEIVAT